MTSQRQLTTSNTRQLRGIALALLFFFCMASWAQTDTLYLRSYYNNLLPRLVTSYKKQFTFFETKTANSYSADYFSTGNQSFIGFDLSYKWASIGYNVSFNPATSSTNTDFRFSTSYRHVHLQATVANLKNLDYYRITGKDKADTVFIGRQHGIQQRNLGIKVDYVFNPSKFLYSNSFSPTGRQLKSKGSFILTAGIAHQDFDLRGLSDSAGQEFVQNFRANTFKTLRIDAGLGYGYNWVIKKNLVFSITEIPNIGFQQTNSSENMAQFRRHPTVSFTNYVRANLVYTYRHLFVGIVAYNSITASRWYSHNYNTAYTSCQFYVGLVLNDPKARFKI